MLQKLSAVDKTMLLLEHQSSHGQLLRTIRAAPHLHLGSFIIFLCFFFFSNQNSRILKNVATGLFLNNHFPEAVN